MCLLNFFFNNKKNKKISPKFDKFENELFMDVFTFDKYSVDIESPCECTNIENNYQIQENYFCV